MNIYTHVICGRTKKLWIYITVRHTIIVYSSFTLNSDSNRSLLVKQKFNVAMRINSTHLKLLNVFNAYSHFRSIRRKIENEIQTVREITTQTMVILTFLPSDRGYLVSVFVMIIRAK